MTTDIFDDEIPTYPTLNRELLAKTLAHIQQAPEGWDQGTWRQIHMDSSGIALMGPTACGASMCFAGEAVQLADPHLYLADTDLIAKAHEAKDTWLSLRLTYLSDTVLARPGWRSWSADSMSYEREVIEVRGLDFENTQLCDADTAATYLLGITRAEANLLFHANNTLPCLEAMVTTLLDGNRGTDALEECREEHSVDAEPLEECREEHSVDADLDA